MTTPTDPRDHPDPIRLGVGPAREPGVPRQFAVDSMAKNMPDKIPGRHRWITICSYTLTDTQAAAAAEGAHVTLKPEMLTAVMTGCVDCEVQYNEARLDPCAAGDEWNRP